MVRQLHLRLMRAVALVLMCFCATAGQAMGNGNLRDGLATFLSSEDTGIERLSEPVARIFADVIPADILPSLTPSEDPDFPLDVWPWVNVRRVYENADTSVWALFIAGGGRGFLTLVREVSDVGVVVASADSLDQIGMVSIAQMPGHNLGIPSNVIRITGFVGVHGNTSTELLAWDGRRLQDLTPDPYALGGGGYVVEDVDGDGFDELLVLPGGPQMKGAESESVALPVFKFDRQSVSFKRQQDKIVTRQGLEKENEPR